MQHRSQPSTVRMLDHLHPHFCQIRVCRALQREHRLAGFSELAGEGQEVVVAPRILSFGKEAA